jgi:hypothetical protein
MKERKHEKKRESEINTRECNIIMRCIRGHATLPHRGDHTMSPPHIPTTPFPLCVPIPGCLSGSLCCTGHWRGHVVEETTDQASDNRPFFSLSLSH